MSVQIVRVVVCQHCRQKVEQSLTYQERVRRVAFLIHLKRLLDAAPARDHNKRSAA